MSILTMTTPSTYQSFNKDLAWDPHHHPHSHTHSQPHSPSPDSSRPRTESKQVALPSIRQTFPDLHLESSLAHLPAERASLYRSPGSIPGPLASPEYVHSPNAHKKRRVSVEDERESLRAKQVPRFYRSPDAPEHCSVSPQRDQPHVSSRNQDAWATGSARNTAYGSNGSAPLSVDMARCVEAETSLPSLPPPIKYDRDVPILHQPREPSMATDSTAPLGERPAYQGQEYAGYAYHHHPSRYQSLSTSAIRPHEHGPYSAGAAYGSQYQDMARYGDMGIGGDAKQRKRRGNLPKETTDKLRAWFVAHLQHPYPTEDEKQDLMRQTGLQMNQISNWFINARRRQLPAMINNARAESDAMNGRVGIGAGMGTILASTEHSSDYGSKRDDGLTLSDGEGFGYDDLDSIRQRRGANLQRESV